MATGIGYIDVGEIRARAEAFLAVYHPSGDIPVPIEDIVEFGLEIEMFPLPDAQKLFGIVTALSSDLQTIVYDEHSDRRYRPRFRFTLAHEVGHRELHADLIRSLHLASKQDWKRALTEINPGMYTKLENEASIFAEYVLVPTGALIKEFDSAKSRAMTNGIDLHEAGDRAVGIVASSIARYFDVSTPVIEYRIRREQLSF